MSVKYYLLENMLTEKVNDYSARVVNNDSITENQLIDQICNQGSGITHEQALAVWEGFKRTVTHNVELGRNINTSLFNLNISISGAFNGPSDTFKSEEHKVKLNLTMGTELKKCIGNIKVEKISPNKPIPLVLEVCDVNSQTYNELLTPGNIGEVWGSKLKFNPEDDRQGIFLTKEDGTEIKVHQVSRNKNTNLMFLIPAELTSGKYNLTVRAILNNGKELREGKLKKKLRVE